MTSWQAARTVAQCTDILTAPGMPFELVRVFVEGRMLPVFKYMEPNLRNFFLKRVQNFASREYVIFENERYTYADTRDLVFDIANTLWLVYGIHKGDRVAICMRNLPESVFAFWACAILGAVPTYLNAWQTPESLAHSLCLTNPKLLLVDHERLTVLSHVLPDISASIIVARVTDHVLLESSSAAPWQTVFTGARAKEAFWHKEPPCGPEDDASIMFTSGSTALPRAVLNSQRAFISNTYTGIYLALLYALRRGEELPIAASTPLPARGFLVTAPLFHVQGLTTNVMVNMFRGNKLVLMRKWDVAEAARLCTQENITETAGAPAMLVDMIRALGGKVALESATSGAAPMPPSMFADFTKAFPGAALIHAYGLTETSALVTAVVGNDCIVRPGTCGLPSPITEIKIVDPNTNQALPARQVGEIWVRGVSVMNCYVGDQEATAKAITPDGWFRTGDLGMLDEEGFLYIKDRLKDMIVRGGENIHSTLIEDALYSADTRIREAAAVAVPDQRLGELPAAVVSMSASQDDVRQLSEQDVIERVRSKLPAYAVPVMVLVQGQALARNAAGKMDKQAIRVQARTEWERRGSRIARGKL